MMVVVVVTVVMIMMVVVVKLTAMTMVLLITKVMPRILKARIVWIMRRPRHGWQRAPWVK